MHLGTSLMRWSMALLQSSQEHEYCGASQQIGPGGTAAAALRVASATGSSLHSLCGALVGPHAQPCAPYQPH